MLQQVKNSKRSKGIKTLHTFILPDGNTFSTTFCSVFINAKNKVVRKTNYQYNILPKGAIMRLEMIADLEGRTSLLTVSKFIQRNVKLNVSFSN